MIYRIRYKFDTGKISEWNYCFDEVRANSMLSECTQYFKNLGMTSFRVWIAQDGDENE